MYSYLSPLYCCHPPPPNSLGQSVIYAHMAHCIWVAKYNIYLFHPGVFPDRFEIPLWSLHYSKTLPPVREFISLALANLQKIVLIVEEISPCHKNYGMLMVWWSSFAKYQLFFCCTFIIKKNKICLNLPSFIGSISGTEYYAFEIKEFLPSFKSWGLKSYNYNRCSYFCINIVFC